MKDTFAGVELTNRNYSILRSNIFKYWIINEIVSMSESKKCFFVAPIGDDGSDIRDRSNKLMEYIIDEAISDYGYSLTRADQMDQPGSITSQVIQETVNSDLVIADLTGHNPNVFYELAVRHATGKPCIQMININDSIPFDISDLRTVKYGLEVEEAQQAKEEIQAQLELLEEDESEFDNPISRSAEMQSLRESGDPTDQNLADVLQGISKLNQKVSRMEREIGDRRHKKLSDFGQDVELFDLGDITLRVTDGEVERQAVMEVAQTESRDPEELIAYFESHGIDVI